MPTKAGSALLANSRWILLSMAAVLGSASLAMGSPADAADFTPGTHGFLDTGGSFIQIDVPGASRTFAFGINDAEQIVGFSDHGTGDHGFVYSGGSFTQIDVPGASYTHASGINDVGQIVGSFSNFSSGP